MKTEKTGRKIWNNNNCYYYAFEFVLMKEGMKETESRVEVTMTIGYNNNKQTKKFGHHVNHSLHVIHPIINTKRTDSRVVAMYVLSGCVPIREKHGKNTPQTRKKAEATNQEEPIDSEKSRSDKSRKIHRLGKNRSDKSRKKPQARGKNRSDKSRKKTRTPK